MDDAWSTSIVCSVQAHLWKEGAEEKQELRPPPRETNLLIIKERERPMPEEREKALQEAAWHSLPILEYFHRSWTVRSRI